MEPFNPFSDQLMMIENVDQMVKYYIVSLFKIRNGIVVVEPRYADPTDFGHPIHVIEGDFKWIEDANAWFCGPAKITKPRAGSPLYEQFERWKARIGKDHSREWLKQRIIEIGLVPAEDFE
ncbi:MAG: hypothetical protein ABIN58_12715 [candidate division WOR-3 bacterium]